MDYVDTLLYDDIKSHDDRFENIRKPHDFDLYSIEMKNEKVTDLNDDLRTDIIEQGNQNHVFND